MISAKDSKMLSLNERFETARTNIEYIKLAKTVTKKFNTLSKTEKVQCFYLGLYQALKLYKNPKSKFTSYLWKMIYWECLKFISDNYDFINEEYISETSYNEKVIANEYVHIEKYFPLLIKGLPRQLKTILRDKYCRGMTLHEIGAKHKFSYETSRARINEALGLLRKKFKNDVHKFI